MNFVYTIGHSTHSAETFADLLLAHKIEVVVDVRSMPFSRFNPQFNRENLKQSIGKVGIRYVFMGKELGARSDDPSCYVEGKVQYPLLANTPEFLTGIERVLNGANTHRMALMCAEKDPLECHRTILVARVLASHGIEIRHILSDGSLEDHVEAIDRLREQFGLGGEDLFTPECERVAEAYARQAERIAYVAAEHEVRPE
jgi:uncharacterized protein (DUF488 family)